MVEPQRCSERYTDYLSIIYMYTQGLYTNLPYSKYTISQFFLFSIVKDAEEFQHRNRDTVVELIPQEDPDLIRDILTIGTFLHHSFSIQSRTTYSTIMSALSFFRWCIPGKKGAWCSGIWRIYFVRWSRPWIRRKMYHFPWITSSLFARKYINNVFIKLSNSVVNTRFCFSGLR